MGRSSGRKLAPRSAARYDCRMNTPSLRSTLLIMLSALAACGDDGGGLVDARRTTDASGTTTDAPSSTVDAEGPAIDAETPPVDAPGLNDASVDAPIVPDAAVDAAISVDAGVDAPVGLAGEACAAPQAITLVGGAASISATTAGYTNDHQPGGCAGVNSAGPDRVHAISVPAGQRLTASVVPTAGTYDPGIFVIAAPAANCDTDPPVCLASNDAGGDGATDAITYNNTTAAAVDAFIIIDGFRLAGDAYTLNVAVAPIP